MPRANMRVVVVLARTLIWIYLDPLQRRKHRPAGRTLRDCEWTARTDTVADRSAAMVEHHVTTGHDIESVSSPDVLQFYAAE